MHHKHVHISCHAATLAPFQSPLSGSLLQVVDELFSYWTLEDSEDTLEQLEELLIVRFLFPSQAQLQSHMMCVAFAAPELPASHDVLPARLL